VVAGLSAVVAAVVLAAIGIVWVLVGVVVLVVLHAAGSWRRTLLGQRNEARTGAASARLSAARYSERLELFKALRPRADEASRFYSSGPGSLEEFAGQMGHAVRVLREHGEETSADELERLRLQLLALGDQPSQIQYRDVADQIVQYMGRLIYVHSLLFSDTPEIAGLVPPDLSELLRAVTAERDAALETTGTLVPPGWNASLSGEQRGEGTWIPPGYEVNMAPGIITDDRGNIISGGRILGLDAHGNTFIGGSG
jgi:hypothetical protein